LLLLGAVLLGLVLVAGCGLTDKAKELGSGKLPVGPQATATTAVPDYQGTAQAFLKAWEQGLYEDMYALLSAEAQARASQERFVGRYQAITSGSTITSVKAKLTGGQVQPPSLGQTRVELPFTVEMQTGLVGPISELNAIPLVLAGDQWRVDWTPSLVFKDLTDDTLVRLFPDDPTRGSILDRKGQPLAAQGQLLSVGLVPGQIKDEGQALSALSAYLSLNSAAIKQRYANAKPDWWVPLKDLPISQKPEAIAKLGNIPGVLLREERSRVYPNGEVAAHVVGYVSPVTADDLARAKDKGYDEGDYLGRTGVEAWAQDALAGKKGGKLAIVTAGSEVIREIAQKPVKQGSSIQLSIDLEFQRAAEKALGDRTGSIVALDPRDGSILALVSKPAFDPNSFVVGLSTAEWQRLSQDPRHVFQNRAVQSAYPTGSIFKVITMSAGLEKGGYQPTSPFVCTGRWDGLGNGVVLGDWVPGGHGRLNLSEGLTQSCDIVFYELSKTLGLKDPDILPGFARAFGLGQPTGVMGLEEVAGTLPDPAWKKDKLKEGWWLGDTVNLGIGQGYLEATPLQMANLYAAIANGGTLRVPLLVKQITEAGGEVKTFQSAEKARIPVSEANLAAVRQAMEQVTASSKGTAYYAFRGFQVPTAAKTGSAENQNPDAHAWFASYAPANAPEIVVLVMLEEGKMGGQFAAPVGRQVLEAYFKGR